MLLVLIYWIYTSFICLITGHAALHWMRRVFKSPQEDKFHPSLLFVVGLSVVTWLGNSFSIMYRVNWEFALSLFLLSLIWSFFQSASLLQHLRHWQRNWQESRWFIKLTAFFFIIIALLQTSGTITHYDEAGYYLPLVKWIEQYPVVPGSAWFLDRIAYNSGFHMSSAIFSLSFLKEGGFNDLTACLFVWINIWLLSGFQRLCKRDLRYIYSDLLMTAAMIFPFSFLNNSMDSDYPNIFIGLMIIVLWFRKVETSETEKFDGIVVTMFMLGLYLCTVRVFSALFLVFPAYILIANVLKKRTDLLLSGIITGIGYLLPWLIRNYYLSGYLVYPFYFVDIFNSDWKLPLELAKANYINIAEYAKRLAPISDYAYGGVEKTSVSVWFPVWKEIMHRTILDTLVFYCLPVCILCFFVLFFRKTKTLKSRYFKFTLFFIFLIICFWFFNFPGVRFAWTWILSFMTIVFAWLAIEVLQIPKRIFPLVFGGLIALMLLRGMNRAVVENASYNTWIVPTQPMQIVNFQEKDIGGFKIKIAPGEICGGLQPPCKPYHNFYEIEMRGATILDGFRKKRED